MARPGQRHTAQVGSVEDLQAALGIPDSFWLGNVEVDLLSRELGRGSDAAVYEANFHGQRVAVKVLHPILMQPSDGRDGPGGFLDRFGQECLRQHDLAHENVCPVLGVGRAPNESPCLVMEHMDGTLANHRDAKASEREGDGKVLLEVVSYFLDIATGLRYLHCVKQVIHRDLKPENVLLKNRRAKIADIGLAKSLREASARRYMTQGIGTPSYMAPEVAHGEDYSFPADIFQFGVLMMSVLNKRAPVLELGHFQPVRPGGRNVPIPELLRRAADIAMVPLHHPLRHLIVSCVSDRPSQRPTAVDVHTQLIAVRDLLEEALSICVPDTSTRVQEDSYLQVLVGYMDRLREVGAASLAAHVQMTVRLRRWVFPQQPK